jgi:neutral ceramidase
MRNGMILIALLAALPSGSQAASEAVIEAGCAVEDITPALGGRMSGYFHERLSTGVHDPLQAKALVLKGDSAIALVGCDLIGVPRETALKARQRAAAASGIAADRIMIAGTHTHTGPLYFGARKDQWHAETLARDGRDPAWQPDYPDKLADAIASAVKKAAENCRPVTLEIMTAEQQGLSFNRRFHMKGGGPVRFNPGKMNPDILRPAGPIDPEVHFMLVRNVEDSNPICGLTVFPLHLDTVGGTEYAADFPHYLERTLRGAFGADFISLFGNGACGDINHVDVSHKGRQRGHEEAERIGTTLGKTILGAIDQLKPIEKPAITARRSVLEVPMRPVSAEEIKKAEATLARVESGKVPFLEHVAATAVMKRTLREGKHLDAEVQVFRIGEEVAITTLPGEIFVDLGLAIKAASPYRHTLVIELANGYPGYIPTRKAFEEGSYETVNSLIEPGGGEQIADAAKKLLAESAK